MFSAGDSSGEGVNSLNQFGNVRGSVDWAALAQQWIQMRDNNSSALSMPDAPPPPNISSGYHDTQMINSVASPMMSLKKTAYEEKGEADMDMDEDDEHVTRSDSPPPPAPSMQLGKTRAEVMQSQQTVPQTQWFVPPSGALPAADVPAVLAVPVLELGNGNSHPTVNPAQWNSNAWPPRIILPPPTPILPVPVVAPSGNPTAHIPSLMKINVPNPNTIKTEEPSAGGSVTMDAAKRKILPAWIREGLEKMEREKQKQLERQQQTQLPSDAKDVVAAKVEGSLQSNEHTVKSNSAKFLESDSSGNEEDDYTPVEAIGVGRGGDIKELADIFTKSKATATALALVNVRKAHSEERDSEATEPEAEAEFDTDAERHTYAGKRSYEERLAELMVVVRRTLTELLLEVTNEEISKIAQEAVNSRKAKASSAQVIRKSALSSITGKLGLAAYDDSSGDENSSSENEASADNDNEDSEEEIKASIRIKRRAFAKISEEIEERIAASATREEQKLKYYTQIEQQQQQLHEQDVKRDHTEERAQSSQSSTAAATVSKGYERDFGETTDSKLQHSNGKRQKERSSRKERTTRFSDNKDSKSASIVAAASYISQMQSGNNTPAATTHSTTLFPIATSTTVSTPTATTTMPDSNHLYTVTAAPLSNNSVAINKNLMNAAEAAFEKATKNKSFSSEKRSERDHHRKPERERERRHGSHRSHRRRSGDDSSSSDSNSSSSSSSNSSQHSKYSHASSSKYKRDKRSVSSRKHSRSRSRDRERDRGRHHRRHRHHSSDDEYDDYNEHRGSGHRSTHHSTKRRSRSKSRSSYSSSSHRHRH